MRGGWLDDVSDFISDVVKNTSEVPQDIINIGRNLNDDLINTGRDIEGRISETAGTFERNVTSVKAGQILDNFFNFVSENLISVVVAISLFVYIIKSK